MRAAGATLLLGRPDPVAIFDAVATDVVARGALAPERAAAARVLVERHGRLPATALLEEGVAPDVVLRALSFVAGVPVAPPRAHWVIDVRAQMGVPESTWQSLLAVAVGIFDGRPLVAFADVTKIASSAALGLPDHNACVALEPDVRDALAQVPVPPRAVAFLAGPELVAQAMQPAVSPFGPLTNQPQSAFPPRIDPPRFSSGPAPASPRAAAPPHVDKTLLGTGAASAAALGVSLPSHGTGVSGTLLATPAGLAAVDAAVAEQQRAAVSAPPASSSTQVVSFDRPPPPAATTTGVGPGSVVGRFRLESLLGQGGMATVFLARDADNRPAAVKVVHEHMLRGGNGPELRKRFQREVAAMRKLEHRTIVACLDAGVVGDTEYLATELMNGGSLSQLLLRHGKLPPLLALSFFADLLDGLAHAHDGGVVHRDLKPDNLLLDDTGALKIADFGIARVNEGTQITATGRTVGTPAYMSPEQATGGSLDGRSDLYSAGVILYEMLTGRNPFEGESVGATLANVISGNVRPIAEVEPAVPFLVDVVLARLLPYRPDDRLSTAQQVSTALLPLFESAREFASFRGPLIAAGRADGGPLAAAFDRQCALFVDVARKEKDRGQRLRAGLAAFRATTLRPEHKEARAVIQALSRDAPLRFSRSTTPAIFSRESTLESLQGEDRRRAHREVAAGYLAEDNPAFAAAHLRRCMAQLGITDTDLDAIARILPDDEVAAVRGMPARIGGSDARDTVNARGWKPAAQTQQQQQQHTPAAPAPAATPAAQEAGDRGVEGGRRGGVPMAAFLAVGALALVLVIVLAFVLGTMVAR